MANEQRLIEVNALIAYFEEQCDIAAKDTEIESTYVLAALKCCIDLFKNFPTVDAYTEEQVSNIIRLSHQLHATNVELEKEVEWLKSCLNCKIRKECPRHCGKVVHGCDHWEYGHSSVDAVEMVHGRWIFGTANHREYMKCSECLKSQTPTGVFTYCPNCGAKMDGGINHD